MVISPQQVEAFGNGAAARFEAALLAFLRTSFAGAVERSDTELIGGAQESMGRARTFGLKTEREMAAFVASEMLLGRMFYTRPKHVWAARVLDNNQLEPTGKAMLLLDLAIATSDTGAE